MLHTVGQLLDSCVLGSDGVVGRVLDAYFDEHNWEIRYLLLEILDGGGKREIVFSATSVRGFDAGASRLHIGDVPQRDAASTRQLASLRSSRQVLGCAVAGWNGALGQSEDAIFETDSWTLRFLLVDVGRLRPGAVVLIQPDLIEKASWDKNSFRVAVAHMELLAAPEDGWEGDGDGSIPPGRALRALH